MNKLNILYCFLFFSYFTVAQDPYVKLEVSPKTVEKGMPISVVIKTNIDGDLYFDIPDGFVKSGATHSGMSSSMTYTNGKSIVEKQKYQQFTGYFENEGTYRLGPVKMSTSNGDIQSDAVTIEVVKAVNMISENPIKNMDKPLFGIIEQSKKKVYIGEPMILEAKVYAQIEVIQVEDFKPFELSGANETHKVQDQRQVTQSHERIGGKHVMTFKLGKSTVFPEEVGSFEISPFEMVLLYNDPRSFFPERTRLRSNISSLEVLPLPSTAPASFTGGVGKFELTSNLSHQTITQGKVVELKLSIKGAGNLHRVEPPQLQLPDEMILYGDLEEKENIKFSAKGAEGSKSFTYFLQANNAGEINFPEIEMSYFDPESKEYKTVTSNGFKLFVEEDENFRPAILDQPKTKKEEEMAELHPFITTNRTENIPSTRYFTNAGIILLALPLFVVFSYLIYVYVNKNNRNKLVRLKEQKNARSTAVKAIAKLADNELSTSAYLDEIQSILNRFLATKWNCSAAEVNRSFVKSIRNEQGLSESASEKLIAFMDAIEFARYTKQEDVDLKGLKNDLEQVIEEVEESK